MAGVRCFVAVPLPSCLRAPLLAASEAVRQADHDWRDARWVPDENLHITLKFMGDIEEESVAALAEAVGDAVEGHGAFELPFAGLRAVPGGRRTRMIWATFLDPDGSAAGLASAVERAALGFGVPVDERSFRPHATLARARRPRRLDPAALDAAAEALDAAPHAMSVQRVTFVSSRLSPRGATYRDLAEWWLADARDVR